MSVLIHGMEMPTRGHTVTITIVGSGETYVEYYDCKPSVEETIEYKAVPVPPHGRLGDLDRLAKEVKDMTKEFPMDSIGAERYRLFAEFIRTAPTIIQAESIFAEEEKNDK